MLRVQKLCDCCGDPLPRGVDYFDTLRVDSVKTTMRWDICPECSHRVSEFFETAFAFTQGRAREAKPDDGVDENLCDLLRMSIDIARQRKEAPRLRLISSE